MDESDMPPMDAGALATQSHQVTSWKRQPSLGVTSCKSMTSLLLKRISVEQRPGTANGSLCVEHIYIYAVCARACVFNTATQAFTPKVITIENLSPESLLISLSFTGSEREGTVGLHPNVCVHECVYACGMPRVAPQTQSKSQCCPPAHPAALLFTYRYLLSSPLFPLSLSL